MAMTKENIEIGRRILDLEKRIDEMHFAFERYRQGLEQRLPAWEKLELDLIWYSRRRIYDLRLSNQMDRVLYKFQNRKKIWLRWVEEYQESRREEEERKRAARSG